MTIKRIFGIVLILLAIGFTLVSFGSISSFFAFLNQNGGSDAYGIGRLLGSLIFTLIIIGITLLLWIYGFKWVKKTK